VEPSEEVPLVLASDELALYAAEYDSPLEVATLTLSQGGLALETRPKPGFPDPDSPAPRPPPTRMAFVEPDAVIALDPPLQGRRGDFLRDAEGEIAWFRWHGRLHRRNGA
jgi:hypothetical protein